MSDETRLAFAHPVERSRASAGDRPLDRISLRDHIVEVEIGAFQAERDVTQRLKFNVVVEVYPVTGEVDDDVDRILSYDRVTEAIAAELAAERLNLLETLADRVAERILLEPQAGRVFVRIEKLDRGPGALGVEIVRALQGEDESARADESGPHPCIVFLSNDALGSEHLREWIAQMADHATPVVICVEKHGLALPDAKSDRSRRHVGLLAIEQNAWRLAGLDDRCAVVETRTELDWAMKNDQICVWAPSKIVLDAVDGPVGDSGTDLAIWFAGEMQASQLLSVGGSLPERSGLRTQNVSIETTRLPLLAKSG